LAGSEIVLGDDVTLVRIVLHGLKGPVTVAGSTYNGEMPAWARLSDEQIAAVLTFIRGSWTNDAPPVDTAVVTAIRKETTEQRPAWTWAELQAAARDKGGVPSSRNAASSK
jgi:mono/diheme cytochrome c family protein